MLSETEIQQALESYKQWEQVMKTFLFSEEHEHYTVDDYISKGDIGPWYYVVLKQDYDELKQQCDMLREALESANQSLGYLAKQDMLDERFNEVSQNGYFRSRDKLKAHDEYLKEQGK